MAAEEGEGDATADSSGGGGDMKFWLPAGPSPALLAALLAADREMDRAGGHAAPHPALELLTWHLDASCLSVFRKAADGHGSATGGSESITERGVLQLLFDCAVARRVLGGGWPAGSFDAAPSTSRR